MSTSRSSKLSEIVKCCNLISSTKVTEQGKGLSQLQLLLQDEVTVESLNECTDSKREPSWNDVFHCIFEHLQRECDTISKQYHSWSGTKQNNKIKKLQDLLNFVKTFVRLANKGFAKLKLVSFTCFLIQLWKEDIFVNKYGVAMLTMLSESIFTDRKYGYEHPKNTFNDLFEVCAKEFLLPEETRKYAVSSLFLALTRTMVHQFDAEENLHIFSAFKNSVHTLKHIQSSKIRENLLTSLNLFVKWCSTSHRSLCCQFGEECLDTILRIWMEDHLSDSGGTSSIVIEFCSMQLLLHHPGLVIDKAIGYQVNDETTWHRQLQDMLVAADNHLAKQQAGLSYRSKDDKYINFSHNSIALAADVCCILFKLLSQGKFDGSPSVMRGKSSPFLNKIDFGHKLSLLDCYTIEKDKKISQTAKPWIQILSNILKYNWNLFEFSSLVEIAKKFRWLFLNATIDSIGEYGFDVTRFIFDVMTEHLVNDVRGSLMEDLASIWKDCWTVASSCLSQTSKATLVDSALKLLTSLIKFDGVCQTQLFMLTGVSKAVHHMWSSLYLHVLPTKNSLELVLQFGRIYGLQSDNGDNTVFKTLLHSTLRNFKFMECKEYNEVTTKNPLKVLLLYWILGYKEESLQEKSSRQPAQNTLGLSCRVNAQDTDPPKAMIFLNLLSDISPLTLGKVEPASNELISKVLSLFCHKGHRGVISNHDETLHEHDKDDTVVRFLDPVFLAMYKHFNCEEFGLQEFPDPDHEGSSYTYKVPMNKAFVNFIFNSLKIDLDILTEAVLDALGRKTPSHIPRLCLSFFMISNSTGLLLRSLLKMDERYDSTQESFEHWVQKILEVAEPLAARIKKMIGSEEIFLSSAFKETKSLISIFHSLAEFIPQDVFLTYKAKFDSSMQGICEQAYFVLDCFSHRTDIDSDKRSSCFSSHDETLGLTQSASNCVSSGYKRKRYGAGDAPQAKYKRYSCHEESGSVGNCVLQDSDSSRGEVFAGNRSVNNAVSLICTMCNHSGNKNHLERLVQFISDLDPTLLQELKIIYFILERCSSFSGRSSIEGGCEIVEVFQHIFKYWYRDQYISMKFLVLLANLIRAFGRPGKTEQTLSDAILDSAAGVLEIFWNFKSKGKCSFLVRMGISYCLFAVLCSGTGNMIVDARSNEGTPFTTLRQTFSAFTSFFSDSNDAVRLMTADLAKTLFSVKSDCDDLITLQKMTLCCISENSKKLFLHHQGHSSESSCDDSLLSVWLHVLSVILSYSDIKIEKEVHFQVCVLYAKFQQMSNNPRGADYIALRSLNVMAKKAFIGTPVSAEFDDNKLHHYAKKHLGCTLFQWISKYDGKMEQALGAFPHELFFSESMPKLCSSNKAMVFPAVFCQVKSMNELLHIVKKFFLPAGSVQHEREFLRDLVLEYGADILTLYLPDKPLPQLVVQLLNDVMHVENAFKELGCMHFGHILVKSLVKQISDGGVSGDIASTLSHLATFYQSLSKGAKSKDHSIYSSIAARIYSTTSKHFQLVELFLSVKKYFCRARYPEELYCVIVTYEELVSILLRGNCVLDEYIAYMVTEVIVTNASYINLLHERVGLTSMTKVSRDFTIKSVLSCINVLILLCNFIKNSTSDVVRRMVEDWKFIAPFTSIIGIIFQIHARVSNPEMPLIKHKQHTLEKKISLLMDSAESIRNSNNLQMILKLVKSDAVPDANACLDIFENMFRSLEGHNLSKAGCVLMEKVCFSLAKALKNSPIPLEQKIEIFGPKLRKTSFFLLNMTQNTTHASSVFDCILETFKLFPQESVSSHDIATINSKNFVIEVLGILVRLLVSDSHKISQSTYRVMCRLLHIPRVSSCQANIKETDIFLADFLNVFHACSSSSVKQDPMQRGLEDLEGALADCKSCEVYIEWVNGFTSMLLDFCSDNVLRILKPICSTVAKMSSLVVPDVIHDILVNDPTQKARTSLSSYIQTCFTNFLGLSEPSTNAVKSMQCLLDVIQFLRSQSVSDIESTLHRRGSSTTRKKSTQWDNNFWLDIDYLLVSQVAAACNRPFIAILSCEIWTELLQVKTDQAPSKVSKSCRSLLGALDFPDEDDVKPVVLHPESGECNELLSKDDALCSRQVLIQVYSEINDIDGLLGLCKGCPDDTQLMMHIHESECNWEDALECYCRSIDRQHDKTGLQSKISSALKYSGLQHIEEAYIRGSMLHDADRNQAGMQKQYKSAIELGKWDDSFTGKCHSSSSRLAECLNCLNEEDPALPMLVNDARKAVVRSISSETTQTVLSQPVLVEISTLFALKEIEDAYEPVNAKISSNVLSTLQNWEKPIGFADSTLNSYDCANRILSNRHSLLQVLKTRMTDNQSTQILERVIEKNLFMQIENAANGRRGKLALLKIESLKHVLSTMLDAYTSSPKFNFLTLQEAEQLWKLGRKRKALSVSEDLQSSLQEVVKRDLPSRYENAYLLAKILQLQGRWFNDARIKGPSIIMENYFKKSVDIAVGLKKSRCRQESDVTDPQLEQLCVSGYESLAKFSDAQYQETIDYMMSNEFEQKRKLVREAKSEMKKAQSKSSLGQNQKYVLLLQKNYNMDLKTLNNILEKREKFLLSSLENYVKCLILTDEYDILMYRICSLWFSNTQSSSLPGLIECACKELKTHKFVEMSYQLAARLDSIASDKTFQNTLENLLLRVATDHPHHVLPVLFALTNAYKDAEVTKSGSRKSSSQTNTDSTSASAQGIVARMKTVHPQLVTMMGDLSNMYIQLANWDVSRYSKMAGAPISFDKNLLINRYIGSQASGKYSGLAIPTVEIPISKTNNYENISTFVSLVSFKDHFKLCGGINLPKIVVALGSDGVERKHLVKGRDDLRQDSVMEQVFKVVNALLEKEKDGKALKLRTYKVVPLSQRSGLVEWCEGTMPIGNYLIGVPAQKNFGAHHRYNPKDLFSVDCRRKLSLSSGKPLHQKLATYKDICEHFKPVFRHFFYEYFCDAKNWFCRRTAYCKSVAASSIVGYILGLGDRHVQNILIDCTTGEVIHIDLGVAFEQGKCLPTPEMVPFRLTRDIVDGFGSSGVEGTFRRNCERTVYVLRKSIDTISTIVEVLLHDPLHDWMMTSGKALQVQRHNVTNAESEMTSSVLSASTVAELLHDTSGSNAVTSKSSLAGRALLRVQEKLRGVECGSVLSIEGQVNLLIQHATDEEKLCAMYAGWQPYI